MSWQVWTSNNRGVWKCAKSYPYRIQAVIWCYMHGYAINMGRYGQALNNNVKIVGVGKDSVRRQGENKWKNKN